MKETGCLFKELVDPRLLAIIVTHHCTSACKSCCFNCSPTVSTMLSYDMMIDIIDSSVKQFPGLKVLVLTGGEVLSLDINIIKNVLSYAKGKGLSTRIVSNGFWASNITKTYQILNELVDSGLDEVNLSTGDEHLKFVPLENILNVAICAEKIDSLKTCLIVVEKGLNKMFCKAEMIRRVRSVGDIRKTQVIDSPWVDLDEKTIEFQNDEIISEEDLHKSRKSIRRGCYNLFDSIQVSPEGQLLACCGFAAEYSPLLKMGDFLANKNNLHDLYLKHTNDLLKLWLFVDGPLGLFEYFNPGITLNSSMHQCEICARILSNPFYLNKIASLDKAKVQDILLRLQMKINNK